MWDYDDAQEGIFDNKFKAHRGGSEAGICSDGCNADTTIVLSALCSGFVRRRSEGGLKKVGTVGIFKLGISGK